MKDNFSVQAEDYSKFRPHYPPEMLEYIVSFVKNRDCALDVATGNGQVAAALAGYFKKVYATDISAKQLENAIKKDTIIYKQESAEHTGFANGMFDLITVAQAIHWFDFDAFYKEVSRILKPGGVIAIMGYGLLTTNTEADRVIQQFYKDIIGPYWDPERRHIDEEYKTIPFPFEETKAKSFTNRFTWTFEQLMGYLSTWSAVQHYIKDNNTDPLEIIKGELKDVWEKSDRQVVFPLLLRIGISDLRR